jgi:hypothetical protein
MQNLTFTSVFKVPQQEEHGPQDELTEEQLERIRRNRLLALEKREAKRRRLEEESQRGQFEAKYFDKNVNQQLIIS